MRCDICGEPAVTFVRYNGAHLCAEHFCTYVERRVRREVRREASLERGDTVGVAVSGGKDSMVTLSILSELFGERNGIRLVCISLDEGIEGYRPPSLGIVKDFCAQKGIEYRQRSFSEMGLSMDEVAPISENASPCTYCGVFRRKLMNDEAAKEFLGERTPLFPLLNTENPIAAGMFADQDSYFELHKALRDAVTASKPVIKRIGDEWAELSGRPFDFVDAWGCDNADYIIVVLGSAAGNARHQARLLREKGVKAGVARIRVFRPFPYEELVAALHGAKAVAVLDRSENFGGEYGPVGLEVATALYNAKESIPLKNYMFGLGGHDVTLEQMEQVYEDLEKLAAGTIDGSIEYLGNR